MSFSQLEQNIKKKIAVEENIIRGASALKKKTSNVMVIQKCNTNIREARQNLEYLEDSLKKLRLKTAQQSQGENGSEDNERCNSKEYGFLSTKSLIIKIEPESATERPPMDAFLDTQSIHALFQHDQSLPSFLPPAVSLPADPYISENGYRYNFALYRRRSEPKTDLKTKECAPQK